MEYTRISLQEKENLAILKFNHPEAMNAVGVRMIKELKHALQQITQSTSIRCLLVTGEGRAFCAGANLNDKERDPNDMKSVGDGLRKNYHPLLYALRDLAIPVVTMVNGAAAGVGMSFALMGDIVCAGRSAFFLQAFSRIGLIPDGGSTFILPRLIGWGRAMELSLLAERLPAAKAYEWGLVNFLFEDDKLAEGAYDIAVRLSKGPKSLSLIRKAYWNSVDNSYEAQLELEARLQDEAAQTEDSAEGISAFLEKREAKFVSK